MAGYSGTPLPKKLGIKEGHRLVLLDEPDDFRQTLGELPPAVEVDTDLGPEADVVVTFHLEAAALAARLDDAEQAIFPDGAVWVAWPKKASKVPTDMSEDVVRGEALSRKLVDNKVCAIDETWSGLRLVWRKEHRR